MEVPKIVGTRCSIYMPQDRGWWYTHNPIIRRCRGNTYTLAVHIYMLLYHGQRYRGTGGVLGTPFFISPPTFATQIHIIVPVVYALPCMCIVKDFTTQEEFASLPQIISPPPLPTLEWLSLPRIYLPCLSPQSQRHHTCAWETHTHTHTHIHKVSPSSQCITLWSHIPSVTILVLGIYSVFACYWQFKQVWTALVWVLSLWHHLLTVLYPIALYNAVTFSLLKFSTLPGIWVNVSHAVSYILSSSVTKSSFDYLYFVLHIMRNCISHGLFQERVKRLMTHSCLSFPWSQQAVPPDPLHSWQTVSQYSWWIVAAFPLCR